MTLPDITAYIPKVELPFDVPVLLHPLVVHFMIAIPVIVLLLELINLIAKKKAIGVVSFVLLFLTAVVAVGAYFTGIADGKESFDILSEASWCLPAVGFVSSYRIEVAFSSYEQCDHEIAVPYCTYWVCTWDL
jgi:hypothetical protein